MDEQQLTQFAELAAEAAGRAEKAGQAEEWFVTGTDVSVMIDDESFDIINCESDAIAELIVAHRQDVPALAAAVAALVEEVQKLRQVIGMVDEWEWDTLEEFYFCHWCGNNKNYGHAADCPRQEALK